MTNIQVNLQSLKITLPKHVCLVAVSKTKPNEALEEAYAVGQRDFGENKVQELTSKYETLPKDILWHMIGHLQTNKVKYIAPFVYLIHSVDSLKLLKEINKQGEKNNRVISCLLQVHIAKEENKFGFDFEEVKELFTSEEFKNLKNTRVVGLMGMATNTKKEQTIRSEFESLNTFFQTIKSESITILSMGMSGDYQVAIEAGSNMIRVGSSIFGSRNYST